MIFINFNIYVSSAAILVFWEIVLSEKLRIWLYLFFLLVKMADRQHSNTNIVFLMGLCKVQTGWRMADGGWRMADDKMRIIKCRWKNADNKKVKK